MSRTPYPGYDVLAKWDSPSFNDVTREVLAKRLDHVPARRFLTVEEWALLEAVAARLVPQPDRDEPVPIVPWIDDQLEADRGEGFRFETMPPMREAWRKGVAGIDAESKRRHGKPFTALDAVRQDEVLTAIQKGEVDETPWAGMSAKLFFSDVLLKTVAGIYYAHPAGWSEIGFGGPASPRGYVRMGFGRRDPWEAKEERADD